MPGTSLTWRLSGASVVDGASTIAASITGKRASTTLHELESTLTSAVMGAGNRHILKDTARSGDAPQLHRGKWLSMVTGAGANNLFVAKVRDFQVVGPDGVFTLDQPCPVDLAIGDTYRLSAQANLFEAVTVDEARTGIVDYKLVYLHNALGIALTGTKWYLVPIDHGGATLEFYPGETSSSDITLAPSDRFDPPENQWGLIQHVTFDQAAGYSRVDSNATAEPVGGLSIPSSNSLPLWLRRTVPAHTRGRTDVAFVLVGVSDVTTDDPNPMLSIQPIVFTIGDPPATLGLVVDRNTFINGGARLEATVTDSAGAALDERPVTFTAVSDGSIINPTADNVTDSSGKISATYHSPTNPALEGNTVVLSAKVGAGTET